MSDPSIYQPNVTGGQSNLILAIEFSSSGVELRQDCVNCGLADRYTLRQGTRIVELLLWTSVVLRNRNVREISLPSTLWALRDLGQLITQTHKGTQRKTDCRTT